MRRVACTRRLHVSVLEALGASGTGSLRHQPRMSASPHQQWMQRGRLIARAANARRAAKIGRARALAEGISYELYVWLCPVYSYAS